MDFQTYQNRFSIYTNKTRSYFQNKNIPGLKGSINTSEDLHNVRIIFLPSAVLLLTIMLLLFPDSLSMSTAYGFETIIHINFT